MKNDGWLATILREPMIYFLAAGGLLFGAYELLNASTADVGGANEIVVDRDALVKFMQYRSNAFQFDLFDKRYDELEPAAKLWLLDEYVREEVLFREAVALGLEQNDYIIRRRLIQKLEFLLEDVTAAETAPDSEALEAFYEQYRADYTEPRSYTFTHVFFDAATRGAGPARAAAEKALTELNGNAVSFADAVSFGDRPLYFKNYVERTEDFVRSHLGDAFVDALAREDPSDSLWRGPIESAYGWHAVLMTDRVPARLPALQEIEARVEEDYRRTETERARGEAIDRVVAQYRIETRGLDLAD